MVKDREAWRAAVHAVHHKELVGHDWAMEKRQQSGSLWGTNVTGALQPLLPSECDEATGESKSTMDII